MLRTNRKLKALLCAVVVVCAGVASRRADASLIFAARATSYYPENNRMEGGFVDRIGHRLYTVQDYVYGDAPYVSVAMDVRAFPYGTDIRIPEMERIYNMPILFRVVDTGDAFRGHGFGRIDICTANYRASLDASVNRWVTLIAREN
jgi:3D (Asp-Asp-Asp) domain-containing protein